MFATVFRPNGTVLLRRREVASLGLGAWGGALAQGVCLYGLGVLGALCAYAGYAIFALLVQARAGPSAPMSVGVSLPAMESCWRT